MIDFIPKRTRLINWRCSARAVRQLYAHPLLQLIPPTSWAWLFLRHDSMLPDASYCDFWFTRRSPTCSSMMAWCTENVGWYMWLFGIGEKWERDLGYFSVLFFKFIKLSYCRHLNCYCLVFVFRRCCARRRDIIEILLSGIFHDFLERNHHGSQLQHE